MLLFELVNVKLTMSAQFKGQKKELHFVEGSRDMTFRKKLHSGSYQ